MSTPKPNEVDYAGLIAKFRRKQESAGRANWINVEAEHKLVADALEKQAEEIAALKAKLGEAETRLHVAVVFIDTISHAPSDLQLHQQAIHEYRKEVARIDSAMKDGK